MRRTKHLVTLMDGYAKSRMSTACKQAFFAPPRSYAATLRQSDRWVIYVLARGVPKQLLQKLTG